MTNKQIILFLVVICTILISTVLVFKIVKPKSDFIRQFQSFSVTIMNQSDYDIVSIETGITSKDSKDFYTKTVKSGEDVIIEPNLVLNGEGSIYIKYTNSQGDTFEKGICGYTESLSGYSTITIHNNSAEIEGKCM